MSTSDRPAIATRDLSAPAADSAGGVGWRGLLRRPGVAAAIGLVVALLALLLPSGESPAFLDPRSHDRDGAAALLELASTYRDVDIDVNPHSDTSTALLLVDRLSPDQRDAVRSWVFLGGTLVVADPDSPLAAPPAPGVGRAGLGQGVTLDADCVPPGEIVLDRPVTATVWDTLDTFGATAACYPHGDGAGLVVHPAEQGRVLTFGAPMVLTNRSIGEPGHATLAAALVTHGAAGGLVVLERAPGSGGGSVLDLVPRRLFQAVALLALAGILTIMAVGRRHGHPVDEPVPVRVRAAELTAAVGGLLARTGDREHAAAQLRASVRRSLRRRMPGMLGDVVTPDDVSRLAAALDVHAEVVHRAVVDGPVPDDEALVGVARATAAVHARLTPSGSSAGS